MQSDLFGDAEADRYFDRNRHNHNTFIAQYLLSHLPKKLLADYTLASFGVGSGFNLIEFEKQVKSVHGFDISKKCLESFISAMGSRYDGQRIYVEQANLCKPLSTPHRYDIIIYDWFAYLVSDEELDLVKKNLIAALDPTAAGLLLVHDFIVRNRSETRDIHDPRLRIFKRSLDFWMKHLSDFDMLSFNLFDCGKYFSYLEESGVGKIDPAVSQTDEEWVFCGLFKLRCIEGGGASS